MIKDLLLLAWHVLPSPFSVLLSFPFLFLSFTSKHEFLSLKKMHALRYSMHIS
jgi:hypothetical protein